MGVCFMINHNLTFQNTICAMEPLDTRKIIPEGVLGCEVVDFESQQVNELTNVQSG